MQGQVEAAEDGGEDIVEVVGDASGEDAGRLELLLLDGLLLGAESLAGVLHQGERADHPARPVADRGVDPVAGNRLAVLAQVAGAAAHPLRRGQQRTPDLREVPPAFLRQQCLGRHAEGLGGGVEEDTFRHPVPAHHAQVVIPDDDPQGRLLDDHAQPLLVDAQQLLGLAALLYLAQQVGGAPCHFLLEVVAIAEDVGEAVAQAGSHLVEDAAEGANLVGRGDGYGGVEVAGDDLLGGVPQLGDGPGDARGQEEGGGDGQQQGNEGGEDGPVAQRDDVRGDDLVLAVDEVVQLFGELSPFAKEVLVAFGELLPLPQVVGEHLAIGGGSPGDAEEAQPPRLVDFMLHGVGDLALEGRRPAGHHVRLVAVLAEQEVLFRLQKPPDLVKKGLATVAGTAGQFPAGRQEAGPLETKTALQGLQGHRVDRETVKFLFILVEADGRPAIPGAAAAGETLAGLGEAGGEPFEERGGGDGVLDLLGGDEQVLLVFDVIERGVDIETEGGDGRLPGQGGLQAPPHDEQDAGHDGHHGGEGDAEPVAKGHADSAFRGDAAGHRFPGSGGAGSPGTGRERRAAR